MSKQEASSYIDAHVHVWTDDIPRYPLDPRFTTQDMNPVAYLPEKILEEARRCAVHRIVLVQMSYYGLDNSFMLEAIRQHPKIFRGIAVVDGNDDRADVQMRSLARFGVRGFRLYPEEVRMSVLDRPGYRGMFRCGAEERLAICLLMNPDSLSDLDHYCQKFPDTPVVVDHLARIGMAGGMIVESDVRALCRLATHPQVKVKISAFYALGQGTPPHLDLAPMIKQVYDAFGPRRLMWGSDCPFQVEHETYEDSLSLIRDRLGFIPGEDRNWILARTAEDLFFS